MKFKVLYLINYTGSSDDFAGGFEYYVYEEARNSAIAWTEVSSQTAWLWDGQAWEYFS